MNSFYVLGWKIVQQMASANFYFLENLEDKYQGPVNLRESDRGSDHIPGKQYLPAWAKKGHAK